MATTVITTNKQDPAQKKQTFGTGAIVLFVIIVGFSLWMKWKTSAGSRKFIAEHGLGSYLGQRAAGNLITNALFRS